MSHWKKIIRLYLLYTDIYNIYRLLSHMQKLHAKVHTIQVKPFKRHTNSPHTHSKPHIHCLTKISVYVNFEISNQFLISDIILYHPEKVSHENQVNHINHIDYAPVANSFQHNKTRVAKASTKLQKVNNMDRYNYQNSYQGSHRLKQISLTLNTILFFFKI